MERELSSQTSLVVPVTRPEPPLTKQVRLARAAGADLVELRLDTIGDTAAVTRLLELPHALPFIVTIRTREEGGAWDGDEPDRIALFERLGLLGPGYLDVEYDTWSRSANVRQKLGLVCELPCGAQETRKRPRLEHARRPRNTLILSHHDWRGTPADLDAAIAPLLDSPAGIVKATFTARDALDAWRVMDLLRRHRPHRRIILLAMGEPGLLTRVLAGKFGAFLTFAALERESQSAPGQPTVAELLGVYRWRDVGARTGVFGVVGWPVSHSRSPLIHNAAMAATGVDGVFVPMPVAPTYADFAAFMDYLTGHPELEVCGLSITLPHKEHAVRWLAAKGFGVSDIARRAGAVNTLTRSDQGAWIGDNTDIAGAVAGLRHVSEATFESIRGCDVAVLGAGGAARALIIGLTGEHCRVTVFNRTAHRAESLARELSCGWRPWEDRIHTDAQVIINCTSVGMHPLVEASPLPPEALRPGTVVFDTVYTPAETRLLREARLRGCAVVSGVEMFIGQAALQFRGWHGQSAPLDVMRAALSSAT